MVSFVDVVLLLVIFQFKHFLADYPLQNAYMLGKFKPTGWVLPLSAHCAWHFGFTLLIVLVWTGSPVLAVLLGLMDFVIHFTMDRIKASPNMLGKYKHTEAKFWYALGLDQMVHHLTHYLIIICIIKMV